MTNMDLETHTPMMESDGSGDAAAMKDVVKNVESDDALISAERRSSRISSKTLSAKERNQKTRSKRKIKREHRKISRGKSKTIDRESQLTRDGTNPENSGTDSTSPLECFSDSNNRLKNNTDIDPLAPANQNIERTLLSGSSNGEPPGPPVTALRRQRRQVPQSEPGALRVDGVDAGRRRPSEFDSSPLETNYATNSSMERPRETVLEDQEEQPILEASLVEDSAKNATERGGGEERNKIVSAVIEGRIVYGVNIADSRVQIVIGIGMIVLLFVALTVGLGVAIMTRSSRDQIPAASSDFPSAGPSSYAPSGIPSLSPTTLTWEKIGRDFDGHSDNEDVNKGVGRIKDGMFGSVVALSNDGRLLLAAFDEPQTFLFRGAMSFPVVAKIYEIQNQSSWVEVGFVQDDLFTSNSDGVSASFAGDGLHYALAYPRSKIRVAGVFVYPGDELLGNEIENVRSVSLSHDGQSMLAIMEDGMASLYDFISECYAWINLKPPLSIDGLPVSAISLSGDGELVVLGANELSHCSFGMPFQGIKVRAFQHNATIDNWMQIGFDIVGETNESILSDKSISTSTSGSILAIGTSAQNASGCVVHAVRADAGRVRIFELSNETGEWTQMGGTLFGQGAGDKFGISVSLAGDGKTVAIGSSGYKTDENGISGGVMIFEYDGNDWNQIGGDLVGSRGGSFGSSVALSDDGGTIAVGSPTNNLKGTETETGSVSAYRLGWTGSASP